MVCLRLIAYIISCLDLEYRTIDVLVRFPRLMMEQTVRNQCNSTMRIVKLKKNYTHNIKAISERSSHIARAQFRALHAGVGK